MRVQNVVLVDLYRICEINSMTSSSYSQRNKVVSKVKYKTFSYIFPKDIYFYTVLHFAILFELLFFQLCGTSVLIAK